MITRKLSQAHKVAIKLERTNELTALLDKVHVEIEKIQDEAINDLIRKLEVTYLAKSHCRRIKVAMDKLRELVDDN